MRNRQLGVQLGWQPAPDAALTPPDAASCVHPTDRTSLAMRVLAASPQLRSRSLGDHSPPLGAAHRAVQRLRISRAFAPARFAASRCSQRCVIRSVSVGSDLAVSRASCNVQLGSQLG